MRGILADIELTDAQYAAMEKKAAIRQADNTRGARWRVQDEIRLIAESAVQKEANNILDRMEDDGGMEDDPPVQITQGQQETTQPPTLATIPDGGAGGGETVNEEYKNNDTVQSYITVPGGEQGNTPLLPDDARSLLLRLVECEAGGEVLEGKVAVIQAVYNRVNHPGFPDSVKDVIESPGQFSPVSNGAIWMVEPSAETQEALAAYEAGMRPIPDDYVYFNCTPIGNDVIQIGNQYFGR